MRLRPGRAPAPRASRALAALLALAVASASLPCAAQATPPPDAVAQARQHFTRGVKLYEEDDFRTALIEFTRAYELAPNWQVLYNIGQASYQLRDYANALKTLERYVAAGGASIAPDRRQQVDKEMDELRGRVAHVSFASNARGAEVSVDDVPLGTVPFGGPELVGAGRHKIVASKLGWGATTRIVDIAGGDNLTITLDLREETTAPQPLEPAAPPERAKPSYAATLVIGGIGLAGVAVGTVFGVLALNDHATLSGECNASRQCPYGTQSEIDSFSRDGLVSTIGFGVGAAGLVTAFVLFATERAKVGHEPPPSTATHVRAVPWIGPGGAGLSGTF
jgi:hypothetical protein